MKIYLLGYFDDLHWPSETLNALEIYTEQGLKRRLHEAIINEQLCESTLEDNNLTDTTDCEAMTIRKVIRVFRDDGYTVEERTID